MKLLNRKHVTENQWILSYCLNGQKSDNLNLKQNFISSLNSIQMVQFDYAKEIKLEFTNDNIVDGCIRAGFFSQEKTQQDNFLLKPDEIEEANIKFYKGMELIKELNYGLYELINSLINTVFFCRVHQLGGGSVTSFISMVWLSPRQDWTHVTYAENMVHEFIHHSLFLDDMIRNVFPEPSKVFSEEAMAISSILKKKRHFDKAFHAAHVSIGLMWFYNSLGDTEKANSYYLPLKKTVEELIDRDLYFQNKEDYILSAYGRELLSDMSTFVREPYYEQISSAFTL
jgi:hypothetical protein